MNWIHDTYEALKLSHEPIYIRFLGQTWRGYIRAVTTFASSRSNKDENMFKVCTIYYNLTVFYYTNILQIFAKINCYYRKIPTLNT